MNAYLGIDPGQSGGISIVANGHPTYAVKMPDTERDILETILGLRRWMDLEVIAALEQVASRPGQSCVATFKFGMGYGGLRMALIAAGIPFRNVTPQTWQKALQCLTKGDKNVSKRRAQELFPSIKCTHNIADSLLIAEWLRREERA